MNDDEDESKLPPAWDVIVQLPVAPVSLQASRAQKEVITNAIRSAIANHGFILTNDVKISIEWLVNEQRRYETDAAPDVDNIIKPIIDALCGPQGVLVDDCQVQFVSCHWIDWERDDQQVTIHIERSPWDYGHPRDQLIFIHLGRGLCFPWNKDLLDSKALGFVLNNIERMLQAREDRANNPVVYDRARRLIPAQRFFHITRLQNFPILTLEEIKHHLDST